MEKTSPTRTRRRTCHSKIETYDEFDCKNAFGRVFFNFIKPGEDFVWILRSLEICCGRRSIRKTWETVTTRVFKRGLWSILVFSRVEKWSCSARSIRETGETSWDLMQQVAPHREEPLLDGNAHSVRYGEMIHDGSEKPGKINSHVKLQLPNTQNWLWKLHNYSMNNDKSTEDKHETNHINNEYNDMNTRKMHITWACTESAQSLSHFVHLVSHAPQDSSLSLIILLSTSTCPSPSSPFSSLSCTSSYTLSSTTWSPCKTWTSPRTRGVTTPTTSTPPSQVMSPTSWPSASSTNLQVPSPTLLRHRTRT